MSDIAIPPKVIDQQATTKKDDEKPLIKPFTKNKSLIQELLSSRELPFIIFLAVIILLASIYLSVRKSTQEDTVTPEVQQQTKQMNATIDIESIQTVQDRRYFSEDELIDFPIVIVEPSPKTTQEGAKRPNRLASPSASPISEDEPVEGENLEPSPSSTTTPSTPPVTPTAVPTP